MFYGLEHPNPNTPQFAYPRRGGAKLSGTCIVHTAEMYGALNTAAFCMRRTDHGCYHTVVDHQTIIEIYPYEYETWQDSETNNWAVGISAACRAADWNIMAPEVREGYYRNLAWAAADFVTYMKVVYNIEVPLRRLSGAEARARKPGFCAHGDSGIARSDPGRDFDWDKFFQYIEEELNGEDMSAAEIAKAVVEQPVRYFDPTTGKPTELTTTIGVTAGFQDFQHESTRRLVKDSLDLILAAIRSIPQMDESVVDKLGEDLEAKLNEVTKNIKVTLQAAQPE